MLYFITEYKNQEARDTLRDLGLYCYSLRSSEDDWQEISTIENLVLVNRYGSIITNEEIILGEQYPQDFLDFSLFSLKNTKVNSISDLLENLEELGNLDLSSDEKIMQELQNFKKVDLKKVQSLNYNEKLNFIIEKYKKDFNTYLISNGNHIYQQLFFDNSMV